MKRTTRITYLTEAHARVIATLLAISCVLCAGLVWSAEQLATETRAWLEAHRASRATVVRNIDQFLAIVDPPNVAPGPGVTRNPRAPAAQREVSSPANNRPGSICGNGEIDPGETCDDGNQIGGDGCSADCRSGETCGNGIVDPREACDDGGESARCNVDCTFSRCGDLKIDVSAGEECDNGSANSAHGSCGTDCKLAPGPRD